MSFVMSQIVADKYLDRDFCPEFCPEFGSIHQHHTWSLFSSGSLPVLLRDRVPIVVVEIPQVTTTLKQKEKKNTNNTTIHHKFKKKKLFYEIRDICNDKTMGASSKVFQF